MFGLSDSVVDIITDYFRSKPCVKKVIIFGSRAKGVAEKGSDIDFAVIHDSEKDIIPELSYELEELATPYMFDVIDMKTLQHDGVREHIKKYGKVFYSI